TGALGALSAGQTGGLLSIANVSQLTSLLGGLTGGQLTGALGTLSAGQTGGLLSIANVSQLTSLLGGLTGGQLAGGLGTLGGLPLTNIVGMLSPAQITGLLGGAGGTGSVITGLLGNATGLAGGPRSASAVNGLLGQLTALLGGGLPTSGGQLTDLSSLLGTTTGLLGTSGLDTSLLSGLLATVTGLLANSPIGPMTAPLHGILIQLNDLVAPGTTPFIPGPPPTTTPAVAKTPATSAATAEKLGFTGYRASIGPIRVSKALTSAKFDVTCPLSAPRACLVKVSGTVPGDTAVPSLNFALPPGASTPVTVKLAKSSTRYLKKRGGSLRFTAQTALSSLPSTSQIVKVKRTSKQR
ncbi:MAG: hypothetical protein QOD69_3518, partial [Solirubrobacteraceae bacterium]|nr:hypothetical protein [Solirubrobacteraceae bacterium]